MKKTNIWIGVFFIILCLGIIGYQGYSYIIEKNKIEDEFKASLKDSQSKLDTLENKKNELATNVENLDKRTLYAFYFNPNIKKYVFKKIEVPENEFNFNNIFKLLSQESSDTVINDYKTISINKATVNNDFLSLDIHMENWNKLSNEDQYRIVKSLLWSLYSSTNLQYIDILMDGESIKVDNRSQLEFYDRNYFNPINDDEKYAEITPTGLYFMPIIYKETDFNIIESNLTTKDSEMRTILDNIGEIYGYKIKNIEYKGEAMTGVVKININFENTSSVLLDKEFISNLQTSFKLVLPFKHQVYFNNNVDPVFLNYTYHNNPPLKN